MKRVLSFLLAAILFAAPAFPTSWSSVAEKVLKSTVSLQLFDKTDKNFCSGFVIDSERDYVLTAEHCVMYAIRAGKRFTINGKEATVVLRDIPEDLAVVRVEELNFPELKPSHRVMRYGDPVMAAGYAYGFLRPMVRISNVSDPAAIVDDGWCKSACLAVALDHVGGMSGGPVVDQDGNLVGNVQFGDGKTGYGRTIGVILAHVGKYFGRS